MYASSLMSATCRPRLSSKHPMDDAARPFPMLETTPPVTKIYLGIGFSIVCLFITAVTSLRRISGSLFAVVTSLFEVFLRLDRFLHGGIECFLYSNQTSAKQTWSFLRAPLKFFCGYIVRLAQLRQAKQPA